MLVRADNYVTLSRLYVNVSVYLMISFFIFVQTRRSMVFAKHLRLIGDKFRAKYLNSTDNQDQTIYSEDWTRMKVSL